MTDLLDLARHVGPQAGGTASAWGILLRVTVLLLAAMLVALALRRSSAALRHLVWALSLVGTLLIPLCHWAFPAWQWAILPERQRPASTSIAPVARDASKNAPLRFGFSPPPSDASVSQTFEIPPITSAAAITEQSTATLSPQPRWSWPVFLGVLWVLGTLLGLVWLGIGIVGAWHVARRAQPAADPRWRQILQQLFAPCGFRRPIEVRECPQVSVPMTWGLRRPVILVPTGSAAWSEEAKRSVLLHELGHIRRGDCLVHLLGRLACVAYWFHPLVWLAARQLRKTSEQAADDMVLSSHVAPPDYAEHLVGIAGQMRGLHLFGHVALPMASSSDLEGRVLAILDSKRNHRSLKRKTCYALVIVAVLFLIPCALLRLGYAENKRSPGETAAAKNAPANPTARTGAASATPAAPPTPPSTASGKAVRPVESHVELSIVVARHVLLLEGKKIVTWAELEMMIAALPDSSQAYPHFYITRGAREAGVEKMAKAEIWRLHSTFKLKGHSEGSLWPRTDFRYDQIKTAADLVPNERLRAEGQVVDGKGGAVADAEVLLVMPVDKSISYKSYHVALVAGRVRNPLEHVMTHSGNQGRFSLFPPEHAEFYVVALHPTAGFGLEQRTALSDSGKIRLLPWATLVSRLDGERGERQEASLRTRVAERDGLPEVIFNQYWNDLKKESPADTFRFTCVPPIFETTIDRDFPSEQGGSIGLPGATLNLLPGETRRLDLAPLSDKQARAIAVDAKRVQTGETPNGRAQRAAARAADGVWESGRPGRQAGRRGDCVPARVVDLSVQ